MFYIIAGGIFFSAYFIGCLIGISKSSPLGEGW